MEAVKAFNAELSSLYEVKPPISKAKMTAITRGAIKAIKFYKHVVQSVEKFILKCKTEYKVPGLYVIDSIVRQSRHQFGPDKDVFAPRFAKNMRQTFVNLFNCPPEDKSKIIRVLNLWQKNQVFAPEVIQPLFDLADPNNPIHKELGTPLQPNGVSSAVVKGSPALQKTPTKGSQQSIEGAHLGGGNLNLSDPNVVAQLQRLLARSGESSKADAPVHFDRKLLDFDYGDDDDEAHSSPKVAAAPPSTSNDVSSLLTNPEVLRQLQNIQQTMTAGQTTELDIDKLRKLQEMKQQEDEFDKHLAQTVPNLPFASEIEFKPNPSSLIHNSYYLPSADLSQPPPGYTSGGSSREYKMEAYDMQPTQQSDVTFVEPKHDPDIEVITLDHGDSRSNSPSDDRHRRRRSRSRERSRDRRRSRRSRSRSRSRRHRSRSKEKAKPKESEKERERKKRGLPAIKKDHLSVCSTTLWVGHISKLVHQEDLSNTFGEIGDIVSIDLIPPRGCAFIVMHRRQDAARCLSRLKNRMLHGKALTLAWAPGKGVKGKDLKDYWEGDLGVSYIPWNKIKPDIDLEMLEDGGMIDEDTMPAWMKAKIAPPPPTKITIMGQPVATTSGPLPGDPSVAFMSAETRSVDTSQPPPVPGMLQPPPMALPLVSPFHRLLGMNLPPTMLGVPPPNLMVGLGSPFMGEQMMGMMQTVAGGGMQHDDNMDIEMEDEKPERPMLLSEQLQATMNQFQRNEPEDLDERRERRGRSRDRNNRDFGRDNRFDDNRSRDRKDRPNRWSDQDDRQNREKTLNDRLQQMAMPDIAPYQDEMPEPPPPIDMYDAPPSEMDEWGGGGPPPEDYELPPPIMDDYPPGPPMMDDYHQPPMMDDWIDPSVMEGPPLHPPRMHDDRFGRGGRRRPDFYARDNFGPPRGMRPMRGGRGHPRGAPNMRGPRPGPPWKDRYGPPRFEPDFHRGPPMFDEPPHMRHRGRFERRPHFHDNGPPPESDRFQKRSRWSDQESSKEEQFEESRGGNTPLHDEENEVKNEQKEVKAEETVETVVAAEPEPEPEPASE